MNTLYQIFKLVTGLFILEYIFFGFGAESEINELKSDIHELKQLVKTLTEQLEELDDSVSDLESKDITVED